MDESTLSDHRHGSIVGHQYFSHKQPAIKIVHKKRDGLAEEEEESKPVMIAAKNADPQPKSFRSRLLNPKQHKIHFDQSQDYPTDSKVDYSCQVMGEGQQ